MESTLLFLAVLAPQAYAAPCERQIMASDVAIVLGSAEAAFEKRDKAGVLAAADQANEQLACVVDAVTPAFAARFHRVAGLRAFLSQDEGGAIRSFAAARTIEPNYLLSTTLVPQGHPARILYDMAPVTVAGVAAIPDLQGSVRLDGRDTKNRPTDRPVIFQLFDTGGAVVTTRCLQPADSLPDLPAPIAAVVAAAPIPAQAAKVETVILPPDSATDPARKGPNAPLLYGAVGGLIVSGVLYGIAGAVQADYDAMERVETNAGEFDSLYATNHGLIIGAGVTAGLSAVVGVTSFVVRW